MNRKTILIGAFLVAQCLAVGFLVYRYERVISTGTEVRFKCQAYDPYDPLRGRYLRVTVSERVGVDSVTNECYSLRNKFFARIEASTNGLWRVAEAALAPSAEGVWVKPKSSRTSYRLSYSDKGEDEGWDAFYERQKESGVVVNIRLPDQLFVNEKLAPEAEKILQNHTADAVAVYRVLDGEIVITDIEIGGQSVTKLAAVAKTKNQSCPAFEADRQYDFGRFPSRLSVALKPKDSVRCFLAENVTTGYSWEVVGTVPGFEVRIEHLGAPEPKDGEPMLCGAPGQAAVVVVRTGVNASEGKVKLEYRRPWERDVLPAESITLVISPLP